MTNDAEYIFRANNFTLQRFHLLRWTLFLLDGQCYWSHGPQPFNTPVVGVPTDFIDDDDPDKHFTPDNDLAPFKTYHIKLP